ncbi:beta-1,6-N-acetylglucosaminyltransferase [Cylindrospermum sp. FACHB-282]|uniref:beta-1,6-N-acetylglucosaminyltransferase n=1 Tax=Cylindrospermum sp. FACHB-282 TaxID=2692794 RepID=UPI001688AB02|nr:beta-1,6-N-acetylglucosaminyltransferase [Cylindrospermum sp. FACHB-282]MBD2388336.1 hypothetical protein [Cylindrospermum sp. FACHB-282]
MNIAYIVLAHKYPEQLIRLIIRLSTEKTYFFVHIDQRMNSKAYQQIVREISHISNVFFLKRRKCYWGDYSLVAATLEGFKEIFSRNIDFDWLILLSGQDYPIKSNSQIQEFLRKNIGKSFVDYFPLPRPENLSPKWTNGGFDRINYWHFCLFNQRFVFPGKRRLNTYYAYHVKPTILDRIISRLWFCLVLFFPIKRKFPQGFQPLAGSQFWCLSRECGEYIYNFIQQNPTFVNFFNYVDVPDEIFFQTIILNSPIRTTVINNNLWYMDWQNPNPNLPAILGENDLDKLINSSCLFARKFDAYQDIEILNSLDKQILKS